MAALKIALLGAESTGKTRLASALAKALTADGRPVVVVTEYLREWCEQHGRTPQRAEQAGIAQMQTERVEAAAQAAPAGLVIADTTPLMTAIYSNHLFGDGSLYEPALAHQRSYDLTLLMGLDVPWQADGPQARAPMDQMIRAALTRGGVDFKVIYGLGEERLQHALEAIQALMPLPDAIQNPARAGAPWVWLCDKCSDPQCEHRLLSDLLAQRKP